MRHIDLRIALEIVALGPGLFEQGAGDQRRRKDGRKPDTLGQLVEIVELIDQRAEQKILGIAVVEKFALEKESGIGDEAAVRQRVQRRQARRVPLRQKARLRRVGAAADEDRGAVVAL